MHTEAKHAWCILLYGMVEVNSSDQILGPRSILSENILRFMNVCVFISKQSTAFSCIFLHLLLLFFWHENKYFNVDSKANTFSTNMASMVLQLRVNAAHIDSWCSKPSSPSRRFVVYSQLQRVAKFLICHHMWIISTQGHLKLENQLVCKHLSSASRDTGCSWFTYYCFYLLCWILRTS